MAIDGLEGVGIVGVLCWELRPAKRLYVLGAFRV